jgi:hypothetical protein
LLALGVDSDRSRGFSREFVDRERERRGTSRSAVIGVVDLEDELGAGGVPAHGGLCDGLDDSARRWDVVDEDVECGSPEK